MPWSAMVVLATATGLVALTAWTDWRRREVPNRIVVALVALWAPAAIYAPSALGAPPLAGLACGAVALAAGFAFYALGWLGGADGKLLAVAAVWLGPKDLGFALVAATALLVPLWLATRRARARGDRQDIPFACALAPPAAALLALRGLELPG